MTEIWGVVGTEGVFEQAPNRLIADAWSKYEGTRQWPIKGRPAYRNESGVFWSDGSPVEFVPSTEVAS